MSRGPLPTSGAPNYVTGALLPVSGIPLPLSGASPTYIGSPTSDLSKVGPLPQTSAGGHPTSDLNWGAPYLRPQCWRALLQTSAKGPYLRPQPGGRPTSDLSQWALPQTSAGGPTLPEASAGGPTLPQTSAGGRGCEQNYKIQTQNIAFLHTPCAGVLY